MSRAARLALQITLGGATAGGCAGKAPDAGAPAPVAEPAPVPAPTASAAPIPSNSSNLGEPPRRGIAIYGGSDILILERIEFAPGSTRLPRGADATIATLAEMMKAYPHWHLVCFGRSDANEAAQQDMMALSSRRAEAVVVALVKLGIARERLLLAALGADDPRGHNVVPEEQKHNRSVRFQPQNADGSAATENPP